MSAEKPLPCPFCGGERIAVLTGTNRLSAYCIECGASGPRANGEEAATAAWNTRRGESR